MPADLTSPELALTIERIRQVDVEAVERYGMHSLVLMENAAIGVASWIEARFASEVHCSNSSGGREDSARGERRRRAWLLCGHGNNGGDGFAIARHLALKGWQCEVVCAAAPERMSPDARWNYQILQAGGGSESTRFWSDCRAMKELPPDLILDCILGSGARGPVRPPFDNWVRAANQATTENGEGKPMKIAVDIPTGINAESGKAEFGELSESFEADVTLTFVARKPAMLLPESADRFGQVYVLPIGIPEQQLRALKMDALPRA